MNTFTIEITDTFGGEANYCWVARYLVAANCKRGAINKLARSQGGGWRQSYDYGDGARYDLQGECVCCFVDWFDESLGQDTSSYTVI